MESCLLMLFSYWPLRSFLTGSPVDHGGSHVAFHSVSSVIASAGSRSKPWTKVHATAKVAAVSRLLLDVALDNFKWRSSARDRAVAWAPEVRSPEHPSQKRSTIGLVSS